MDSEMVRMEAIFKSILLLRLITARRKNDEGIHDEIYRYQNTTPQLSFIQYAYIWISNTREQIGGKTG